MYRQRVGAEDLFFNASIQLWRVAQADVEAPFISPTPILPSVPLTADNDQETTALEDRLLSNSRHPAVDFLSTFRSRLRIHGLLGIYGTFGADRLPSILSLTSVLGCSVPLSSLKPALKSSPWNSRISQAASLPAGQDGQPTDSTASGASSASTCSPAPTNQDTAYATSLERFFVPIPNYEAVDHPADTASPTNAQPELPSHGPGRRWHILRQENIK
ncbi:hypothetical protein PCANC_14995 [Puccinia coronata f. sp. avenae]|uniref:Uncharacterized protein n=1 Tax=Puccinia coronata f. sp. avenae TaxID=200324 RepID=A0A2N5SRI3_9BASI|nr:hypothetical protein PCANC_14995 [Puccinia coronata f. sp. avenae]